MIDALWKAVFSWLSRTFDAPTLCVGVLVFVTALSVAILVRADTIEAVLADDHPVLAQSAQPVAWASLMACVGISALLLWPHIRAALSPTFRFRRMASNVDALAQALSNDQNCNRDTNGGSGSQLLALEVEIAALKGQLENVGVQRSPSISDLEGWNDYLPLLRAWVASGDLRTARWYHPGVTAIVDYR